MVQPNIMQDRLQELFPVHYRNGNILMINADCMEVMKHIKEKETELSCVDPPYGIERFKANDGGNSKKIKSFGDKDKNWNNVKPSQEYFNELFRVSQNQIIWGGNNFSEFLPSSEYFIIWDKMQAMPSFARCEMAWTNCHIPAKIYDERSQNISRIHPTQKPVALYKWLLSRYAKPGDKILDTHGGSGSICIACHDLGYDLTWMELDEDYYNAATKRYKDHAAQATLFDPAELTKETQGDLF